MTLNLLGLEIVVYVYTVHTFAVEFVWVSGPTVLLDGKSVLGGFHMHKYFLK